MSSRPTAPLDCAPLPDGAPFSLVLDLSDGARLRGKTDSAQITLRTRFGKLTVPLRHVRSATFVDKTAHGETWREVQVMAGCPDQETERSDPS